VFKKLKGEIGPLSSNGHLTRYTNIKTTAIHIKKTRKPIIKKKNNTKEKCSNVKKSLINFSYFKDKSQTFFVEKFPNLLSAKYPHIDVATNEQKQVKIKTMPKRLCNTFLM